jgi:hypothetical protein
MSTSNLRTIRIALAIYLMAFGLINQAAEIAFTTAESLPPTLPAGSVAIPGVFLVIAGLGALFNREWGMTLGAILCLVHMLISVLFLMNIPSSTARLPVRLMESAYVAFCLVGGVGAWWILSQTRGAAKRTAGSV